MTLEHGRTRYTRGCRCEVCKAAEREYQRNRYRHRRGLPVDLEADEDDTPDVATDSGAVDECVDALARLQVPATAGAPTARTALRGTGYRCANDVVAHAVKRCKELSSRTATDDEAENFEVVKF